MNSSAAYECAGPDLTTIQKIIGHKTLAMVLRYTLMHGQHIDRPIEAIGRNIAGTPGEQSRQHNYTGIIQRLSRGAGGNARNYEKKALL